MPGAEEVTVQCGRQARGRFTKPSDNSCLSDRPGGLVLGRGWAGEISR